MEGIKSSLFSCFMQRVNGELLSKHASCQSGESDCILGFQFVNQQPSNDGPTLVPVQVSNANLVDRIKFG